MSRLITTSRHPDWRPRERTGQAPCRPVRLHPNCLPQPCDHGRRDGYHLQSLLAGEQAGTHWAAPAHFAADQAAADELDPGDVFYPAVVLDARAEVKEDPDFALGVAEIKSWEADSGRSRRTAPSSCGRASRTAGTTRRPI